MSAARLYVYPGRVRSILHAALGSLGFVQGDPPEDAVLYDAVLTWFAYVSASLQCDRRGLHIDALELRRFLGHLVLLEIDEHAPRRVALAIVCGFGMPFRCPPQNEVVGRLPLIARELTPNLWRT